MLLNLICRPQPENLILPSDYSYIMASAIYNLFRHSSPEFAEFIHHRGWTDQNKSFKFYTFGKLNGAESLREENAVRCGNRVSFRFHSPKNEVTEHFLSGLFQGRKLAFNGIGDLKIEQVESLPLPRFSDTEDVFCYGRSPIIVHRKNPDGKKWSIRPDDPDWEKAIRNNLLEKWKVFHGEPVPEGSEPFSISIDHEKWSRRNYGQVKSGMGKERFKVLGYQLAIVLRGPAKLKQFAVETGLGESNAMGFGCIEPASNQNITQFQTHQNSGENHV